MKVRFRKLHPDAKVPTYAKPGDAGADLYAVERVELRPGEARVVRCGVAIELPDGYEAQIRPRSSLSKRGVHVALGTIDSGYRGEIGATALLLDHRDRWDAEEQGPRPHRFVVRAGDRIAQLVIAPVTRATFEEAEELSASERGDGGWGSSGR
jgi:dUTP pyrophosphatase